MWIADVLIGKNYVYIREGVTGLGWAIALALALALGLGPVGHSHVFCGRATALLLNYLILADRCYYY